MLSLRECVSVSTDSNSGLPHIKEVLNLLNNLILPIKIKEYFEEVKTEDISGANMSRLELLHRTVR
jgi:hypothetical protein